MFASLKKRFRNWASRRSAETGTVTLTQRRIYILPSRQGLGFAVVLLVMLLGDINYNLSLGYALTFMLAMVAVLSMLYAFRNLVRLRIRAGSVAPAFAGGQARFVFHFDNPGMQARYQLHLRDDAGHRVTFDLAPQSATPVELALAAPQRGWLDSGRLSLYTEFPLGLFHAWTYIHFDTRGLVYPEPAPQQALPEQAAQNGAGKLAASGDEDFAGLRNYVAGDAAPRIAWKTLAREQPLQVKQFSAPQGRELRLDWDQPGALATEARLRVLTRWVLDADAQGLNYSLRLPDGELPCGNGPAHRAACLRKLALHGLPDGTSQEVA